MPPIMMSRRGGSQPLPDFDTTIFTSSDTFVAAGAGVYRVLAIGGGGLGASNSGAAGGGGSGYAVYAEVTLTAEENVSVTIGAALAALGAGNDGQKGNSTLFGTYFQAPGGGPGMKTGYGGDGFSGGAGDAGSNGGSGGSDGEGTGGKAGRGQGADFFDFIQSRFPDVTLSAGGAINGGGRGSGGGINISGSGNYGVGGYGSSDGGSTGSSNAGALIVAGPYTE